MGQKRGKLTAGKARERIISLEQSIAAREQKLDQLTARLERTENPEERLITARKRLERRLTIEREQLDKLVNLLGDEDGPSPQSDTAFVSEELEDIHRSFEEMRQNVAQIQARFESTELPRDLPSRLSSFEERIVRREEADSDLFAQVLALQTNLDQERQTVRRLSRRIREQDHSIDALREAVEDSVVATVDLAERLEELEENLADRPLASPGDSQSGSTKATERLTEKVSQLQEALDETRASLEHLKQPATSPQPDAQLSDRLAKLEEALARFDNSAAMKVVSAPDVTTCAAPPQQSRYGQKAVFRYGPLPKGRPLAFKQSAPA